MLRTPSRLLIACFICFSFDDCRCGHLLETRTEFIARAQSLSADGAPEGSNPFICGGGGRAAG
jgi:hypothetical protein